MAVPAEAGAMFHASSFRHADIPDASITLLSIWIGSKGLTCEGHGPGVLASCRGLLRPRLWLSEGEASTPGLTKGLAMTFSAVTGLPPEVSPLEGCCEPAPGDSLLMLLP